MTIPQLFRRALLITLIAPVLTCGDEAKRTIVFLGDSITAGYGVDESQTYPSVIQQRIAAANLPYQVVNAGVSGDTTAGGLRRLDWLLRRPIAVLVIALGGNDGLRGVSPETTSANLQAMIEKVKARSPNTRIAVAGMRLPPNLGADYTARFERIFSAVAQKNNVLFIPFLLEGVGGRRDLNQPDQIHPTAQGQRVIAETVWQGLQPLLQPD